ncbi:amastin-like surface protein, putative [Leishmania panamensis]|uniref:Amastin-like surface protein, putative n=2 Tax=Leishmania guyanensis species complex TaxID=38579 RepID=A0A088RPF1_LEIPA|nr:amastin-like surface protein, putative [Leishmania panamensis]AIN97655.1 amastin-like surface protein, putative [Leishmania panamensis]CCM20272.1 amastin-like surface protein, putative [Leishmania guyanensis]
MEWNLMLLLYAALQFIAFLLVLVATPLDMFRITDNQSIVNGYFSLWGSRQSVGDLSFFSPITILWAACPGRLMRFRVAQALAVLSILVYGAAAVLGVVILFCCPLLRWICVMLNIMGAVTVCVVWAAMVLTYFTDEGRTCPALHSFTVYGVGFALLVAAWVLDLINITFLVVPFHIMLFGKADSAADNLEEKSKGESEEHSSQKEEEE